MNNNTTNPQDVKVLDAVKTYSDRGFLTTPITPGQKKTPATDTTGRRVTPEEKRVNAAHAWEIAPDNANVALSLLPGLAGLDVDHYEDGTKQGWIYLRELFAEHGLNIDDYPWEEWPRSTRRGVESAGVQFFFRVPEDLEFTTKPCTDVEIVQATHRYSMVWPSVVEGMQYRWFKGDKEMDTPPEVADLPKMPAELVPVFARGPVRSAGSRVDEESLSASLKWLEARVFGGESRAELPDDVYRYDPMRDKVWNLVHRAVFEGHAGLMADLKEIESRRSDYEEERYGSVSGDYAGVVTSAVAAVKGKIQAGERSDFNWSDLEGLSIPDFSDLMAAAAVNAETREVVELTDEERAEEETILAALEEFEAFQSDAYREKQTKTKTRKRGLQMHSFEDIETKEPSWLWEYDEVGGIPIGAMTVFTGKGEVGKSTACRWMAAQVTHGTLPGHWHGTPKNVLYIAAEESNESMVKPSLMAHGADMARMKWISVDEEANMLTPDDMGDLVELCLANDVALVVVDPMSNFMHGANMNNSSEVRERMRPWTRLAEAIEGSVIAIFHQNKSGSGDVVYGIGGAAAISEVSRSVFGFARDEETGEHVMSQEKNNLGQRMPSLAYRLESVNISGWKKSLGKFDLVGPSDFSAGEVQMRNKQVSSGEKETAQSWLKAYLRENGPTLKNAIVADSTYSLNSLEKAAKALKLKRETQDRAAVWSLP